MFARTACVFLFSRNPRRLCSALICAYVATCMADRSKNKAKDLEKKRGYEYCSWNLFVLIIQLLGIHKLIPDAVVSSYTQAKIAKGLIKYN